MLSAKFSMLRFKQYDNGKILKFSKFCLYFYKYGFCVFAWLTVISFSHKDILLLIFLNQQMYKHLKTNSQEAGSPGGAAGTTGVFPMAFQHLDKKLTKTLPLSLHKRFLQQFRWCNFPYSVPRISKSRPG